LHQEFKVNASTTIDNTFVDKSRINLSSISPIINGLSDHDAQILTVKNIYATLNKFPLKQRTRLTDNETIMNFQTLLKNETWESVYIDTDPNHAFNSFLFTFLNIFHASFTVKYKSMEDKNDCITEVIKLSCQHTSSLYANTKDSNDPKAKVHYIKYCKILRSYKRS
jgi:ribosomal protein L33